MYMRCDDGYGTSLSADADLGDVPDETLMERVGQADAPAYGELMSRHLDRSLGFAERVTGSRADAEEVMQEAFLRVWTAADRWRPDGARFTTWFYRVVLNLCIDRKRKRPMAPLDKADIIVDPAPGADQRYHDAECSRTVALALGTLPDRQRAAIALCYYRGMSNREAAEILSVSVKAIESLLTRGRKAMAVRLAPKRQEILGDL